MKLLSDLRRSTSCEATRVLTLSGMAYFLFIDESGHDRVKSPYEVLAGVAISDANLWKMVNELHDAEITCFGRRYSEGAEHEMKGKHLLKTKVFHHARLNVQVPPDKQSEWACFALEHGALANVGHLRALGLAKIAYVEKVFDICIKYSCRAFASIVETDAAPTATDGLRKDYAYLFERFFYYLDGFSSDQRGIIVFDELEKTQSHLLIDQTHKYFKDTATGKYRASSIIPEPFFVHSDLTTGVQIADLIAYVISWGLRIGRFMTKPARPELNILANKVLKMRIKLMHQRDGKPFETWSFAHISDLRTRLERGFVE